MGHERQHLSLVQLIQQANKAWHGVKLGQPDWSSHSHCVALCVEMKKERRLIHFILNAYWEPLEFELPPVDDESAIPWRRWIDTGLDSPLDIAPWQSAPSVPSQTYRAESRSVVVLFADLTGASGRVRSKK
jgi:glycogen operon protein